MASHPHITLIVPGKMDREDIRSWMKTVRDNAPDGILSSTEITIGGKTKQSGGYVSKQGNSWHYTIPTTRDLSLPEVQKIAIAWDKAYPDGDFEIDYSSAGESDEHREDLKINGLKEIAMSAAKAYHTNWVSEQTDHGWSYGTKFDQNNKRNPMLMPWENLSDRAKLRELKRFEALLEILDQMDLRLSHKR
jgi:hypothetical protein